MSMNRKINSKLNKLFIILIIILVCFLSSVIVVWPLWKFSTSAPEVYIAVVLTITFAAIIALIVRKIMKKRSCKQDKNQIIKYVKEINLGTFLIYRIDCRFIAFLLFVFGRKLDFIFCHFSVLLPITGCRVRGSSCLPSCK